MEYRGKIKGFPKEVVDKMIERKVEAGNSADINILERNASAGFSFEDTIEGRSFWQSVVRGNFKLFFDKYPKNTTSTIEYEGELEGFPKEVVDKMLERQVEAGFSPSIAVFEKRKRATNKQDGFIWELTEEGNEFWKAVISRMEFDVFYEKYPINSLPNYGTKVIEMGEGVVRLMDVYYDFKIVYLWSDLFTKVSDSMESKGYKVATLRDILNFVDDDVLISNAIDRDKKDVLEKPIFSAGLITRAGATLKTQEELLNYKKMETYPPEYEVSGTILFLKTNETQSKKEDITIDSFLAKNQDELLMMADENPQVFDAVSDVLAELRVVYEGVDPTKITKVETKVVEVEPVEEEDDIDFDDMDDMMDDLMDDLLDDIDDFEV